MKIKVVDMPYEQALAQPREKHTPPRRPSMLFRALLCALSAPDLRATHFRCDRVGMERLGPDEPCLVLMNHSCFLDLKIAAAVLYPRPFNIVCTSDGFVGKAGLMRALGCIPTRKFQPDTALVRDMLYAVKKLKSSILLYPEASYSFDGTATPLPESLGKCVKALGVPVVAAAYLRRVRARPALQWAAEPQGQCLRGTALSALARGGRGEERGRDQRAARG